LQHLREEVCRNPWKDGANLMFFLPLQWAWAHCFVNVELFGGLWRVHTCVVTTYRNTVSWQCGRDSWPRNVSKVGYAITLRACSFHCRYLAVASKGWYGYGLNRSGRAMRHITTVRSSRLLDFRGASAYRNEQETA
jgi:hypothetical protein